MLRFGVLTDIQYADRDPWHGRQYREVLLALERGVEALAAAEGLRFVVQLGDLIDGGGDEARDRRDLEEVLSRLERLPQPLVHVLGNHCLSYPRSLLTERLGLKRPYRRLLAESGWRLLTLDAFEVSVCGHPEGSPEHAASQRRLEELQAQGCPGAHEWNGTLGAAQIAWLELELGKADARDEKVALLCHLPIHPAATRKPLHLMWDAPRLLEILSRHPSVGYWICGHDHEGGSTFHAGVHHLTLPGLVNQGADGAAWGTVSLTSEGLALQGTGAMPSGRYPFRAPAE